MYTTLSRPRILQTALPGGCKQAPAPVGRGWPGQALQKIDANPNQSIDQIIVFRPWPPAQPLQEGAIDVEQRVLL